MLLELIELIHGYLWVARIEADRRDASGGLTAGALFGTKKHGPTGGFIENGCRNLIALNREQ
jgi:hypothetical protein